MTHSAEHGNLRARLVQRLAGRGEPLFVAGERVLPAAALFAQRHVRLDRPTDRLDALVNVVAALWERGCASADDIMRLAPHAVGGATAAALLRAGGAARIHETAEFDADDWLATTHGTGEAIVGRLLFGARLVALAPTRILAPHPCVSRAIF